MRGLALAVLFLFLPALVSAQVTTGSPFGGSGGGAAFDLTATHTFTNVNTFTLNNNRAIQMSDQTFIGFGTTNTNYGLLGYNTSQTPDSMYMGVEPLSNAFVISERGDFASDFAHPIQINPTVFIENAAVDTTQHQGLAYYGAQGRAIKALTESTNTSAVRIPVAAGAGVGGTVTFTVFAADATDQQTLSGIIQYAAVNKAGTETCATPTAAGTPLNAVSVGTLTCTFACDTAPANAVDIQFNCTSSLTQTTLDVYYRLNALGSSEPLPQ